MIWVILSCLRREPPRGDTAAESEASTHHHVSRPLCARECGGGGGPTSAHTCACARAYTRSRTLIYSSRTWQRNRSVPPAHTRARAHTRTRMHTHTHTHTHTLISLSRTWHRNRSVPPEHTQVRAHTHTRTRARARTHTHKSLGHGPGVGAGPTAAHESRKRGSGYLRQRIDRP